ncbi:MAG: DUF3800 domain-containing protein [Nitrososphaerales archaeon]
MGNYILDESKPFVDDENADVGFFDELLDYCGNRKVALLRAFFDESERENGLVCVAGYVFASEQARELAKEFRAEFARYGGFHMNELIPKRRGYKNISDDERNRLIESAVNIVRERFSYGVAVTVNKHEYEAQAPRFIRGFKNAYPFLCHLAMSAVPYLAERNGDHRLVHYVFEAGHPFEPEAMFAVGQVAKVPELKTHYRYAGHSFLPKADAVPLQAADLLAWETAKFKDETLDQRVRGMRLSLRSLFTADTKRYQVSFCEGATLTRSLGKYRALGIEQIDEERDAKQKRIRIRQLQRGNGHDPEGRSKGSERADGSGEESQRGKAKD